MTLLMSVIRSGGNDKGPRTHSSRTSVYKTQASCTRRNICFL